MQQALLQAFYAAGMRQASKHRIARPIDTFKPEPTQHIVIAIHPAMPWSPFPSTLDRRSGFAGGNSEAVNGAPPDGRLISASRPLLDHRSLSTGGSGSPSLPTFAP
jgi:hypothetical protein